VGQRTAASRWLALRTAVKAWHLAARDDDGSGLPRRPAPTSDPHRFAPLEPLPHSAQLHAT